MPKHLSNKEMVKICERICHRLVTTPERLITNNPELKKVFSPLMFGDGKLNSNSRGTVSSEQAKVLLDFILELQLVLNDSIRYTQTGNVDYDYMIVNYLSLGNYSPLPEKLEKKIQKTINISLFLRTTQIVFKEIEQELSKYIEIPYPNHDKEIMLYD